MVVADVSDPVETSQSTDRDAEQRVGLGLLLRFIGAVFLVLLGGLLLLDRALGQSESPSSLAGCAIGGADRGIVHQFPAVLLDQVTQLVTVYPNAS